MSSAPLMISVSGVRGIVGESMTAAVARRWAAAYGSLCRPGSVVVGSDSRVSGPMMRSAMFAGLSETGHGIIDVGVVPTPTIQLAVVHHRAQGGIAITASHNPAQWNALKFYNGKGMFLDEAEGDRLRKLVESEARFSKGTSNPENLKQDHEAVRRHIDAVLKIPFLQMDRLRDRRFRVGLDAVCGAGGEMLKTLLEELGCEVRGFHLEPTGMFPRNPEPTPENLKPVCSAMKQAGVDIGFVVDPDADRLAVILENGQPAGEEMTLTAAADLTLQHVSGPVVANCSTTRALDDVAQRYGQAVLRTKVGEVHVAKKIIESRAAIGGEGNGGVMLPSVHAARDSAVGVVLILQRLLDHGGAASDYFGSLPQYRMVKRRMDFTDLDDIKKALARLEKQSGDIPGTLEQLDGLKWSQNDSWVQVRPSNTEPIIRIYAEAKTSDQAEELVNRVFKLLL